MIAVAALWGSYVPALKLLYTMDGPPSVSTYTALHLVISWAFLRIWTGQGMGSSTTSAQSLTSPTRTSVSAGGKEKENRGAAFELAFWDTSATVLQTWGVTLTSALHAGVIICLCTAFVPVLEGVLAKRKPKNGEILACSVAFVGSVLLVIGDEGTSGGGAGGSSTLAGDALTALSALFYAVSMVRIHQKTQNQNTEGAVTGLAVDKVFFGGVIATVWVLADVIASYAKASGGGELDVDVWQSYGSIEQWLLILFISVGPSALSNVLQFKALSKIKPSEGQVILSTVPLWAILFSVLTGTRIAMGGEALAGLGMICFSFLPLFLLEAIQEKRKSRGNN